MTRGKVSSPMVESEQIGWVGYTLDDHTLVEKSSTKGVLTTFTLEEVRDYLRRLDTAQAPDDTDVTMDQLEVDLTPPMSVRIREGKPRIYRVTSVAAHQLASRLLPGHFFSNLKRMVFLDGDGSLATACWQKYADIVGPQRTGFVRTVRKQIGRETVWVIRSCHGTGYASYSNLDFVQDILDNAGPFAHLPVLDWRITDNAMRIRFAGIDIATSGIMRFDPQMLLEEPIPMVEAWNSETGLRRVGLRAGMWRLADLTALGHWDDKQEYNWIHRGTSDRIRSRVRMAFEDLVELSKAVIEAYKRARDEELEDGAFQWIEDELTELPERVRRAAQEALTSEKSVTPGDKLASVIDALLIAARQVDDIYEQFEIERVASRLLEKMEEK